MKARLTAGADEASSSEKIRRTLAGQPGDWVSYVVVATRYQPKGSVRLGYPRMGAEDASAISTSDGYLERSQKDSEPAREPPTAITALSGV